MKTRHPSAISAPRLRVPWKTLRQDYHSFWKAPAVERRTLNGPGRPDLPKGMGDIRSEIRGSLRNQLPLVS